MTMPDRPILPYLMSRTSPNVIMSQTRTSARRPASVRSRWSVTGASVKTHESIHRIPRESAWLSDIRCIECLKDVWLLTPDQSRRGSPVAFPDELVRRMILLYSCPGDIVLDPFAGTGTVGRIARQHGRTAWLIEREPSYWPLLEAAVDGVGQS